MQALRRPNRRPQHPVLRLQLLRLRYRAKAADAHVADRKLWKVLVPVAVILVAALIAGLFYFHSRSTTARLTDKDTIVLADFSNSTGDAGETQFTASEPFRKIAMSYRDDISLIVA